MSVAEVRYLLHADVEVVQLPDDDEVLVGRRGSRNPPQLVSRDAMALAECFRSPRTLVDGVIAYCAASGAEPLATLDAAFGVLVALTRSEVLVADGGAPAERLRERHQVGEQVGPATITDRVRVLRDSEIWRAVLADGTRVVVKVVDDEVHGPGLVRRELTALERGQRAPVPRLVWHESSPTGGTLVLSEVEGEAADLATLTADDDGRRRIALAVVDAYVALHACGVLHGDVHPGNVLVTPDAEVGIIDFGLATAEGEPSPRTAGGEYLDPAAAAALRADRTPGTLDEAAEQYAVAAMVYRLLTGSAPLDLACERVEALRRIAEDRPRPFVGVGVAPWLAVERVLRRALAVDPAHRYRSLRTFRTALLWATATPREMAEPPAADLLDAVGVLDVDGPAWASADDERAAHVGWLLARVATLTGDPRAFDLAHVWSARCRHVLPPVPGPRTPVARAHRALAAYVRTGRPGHRRAAALIADEVGGPLRTDEPVDVLTGGWAGALLRLECSRPAVASMPGRPWAAEE
ncbi:protein kinase domain-containing protein [Cellulomonas edaphi]|uniref:non-specific serine/threonine protein kinase n=1 Tax=Cellulomonas edaphi TaxID=3053468 RepID=A0ABT7S9P2_9CELL|nr:AarF/UbiB family protein [Cellulomons edaphi]MDM7832337.1 AarF/UbiB family protein [Cellulomons edaphi]